MREREQLMASVDFDAPDLSAQIERLSARELDALPFGVILIDPVGTVLFYSKTEARQSGYNADPVGKNLFEAAPCFRAEGFEGRLLRAMHEGPVDLEIGWPRDFADSKRELRIRVQSARRGGVWLFIERD
jgi:photoactive yellow protein